MQTITLVDKDGTLWLTRDDVTFFSNYPDRMFVKYSDDSSASYQYCFFKSVSMAPTPDSPSKD